MLILDPLCIYKNVIYNMKQKKKQKGGTNLWEMICLGYNGGISSGNLSSYIVKSSNGNNKWTALDGGSCVDGMWLWNKENNDDISVLDIEAFLITHVHLDHMIGFVISTPGLFYDIKVKKSRSKMKLVANSNIIDTFDKHVFNDFLWPKVLWNDETGVIEKIECDNKIINLDNGIIVKNMPVQHGNYGNYNTLKEKYEDSTVFFVNDKLSNKNVMYFGDVSSVSHVPIKNSNTNNVKNKLSRQQALAEKQLIDVWNVASDLIVNDLLSAIFIECAVPNSMKELYGHMNANLLNREFNRLLKLVFDKSNGQKDISSIKIFITHRKPDLLNNQSGMDIIKNEVIESLDTFGFMKKKNLIFPQQGKKYCFN